MRRLALFVAPLPLLVLLGAGASTHFADAAGRQLGATFAVVAGALDTTPHRSSTAAAGSLTLLDQEPAAPIAVRIQGANGVRRAQSSRAKSPAPSPPPSLFVPASTVLRLAETRAEPRATTVPADGVRPAGLRLHGVAALGIGLADGDVLTRALGVPAQSKADVVRAVIAARARRARVLEGEVWRGRHRMVLRVEQPYLDARER